MTVYRFRMAGKALEIMLYDDIGASWYAEGVTAKAFADDLKKAGAVNEINLRINSSGGDVADGVAIYNSLNRHPARIIVDIDGVALSIASVIAMAGDVIRMAKNAMMMIHNPWGMAVGTAEELRKQADVMDQFKQGLVDTYAARTKRSAADVSRMMDEETWFTAAQAYDEGFADDITGELAIAARFDATRFRNIPAQMRERIAVNDSTPRLDSVTAKIEHMNSRALLLQRA